MKRGPFAPPALPDINARMALSDSRSWPPSLVMALEVRTSTRSGSPPYCPDRLPGMLCSLPRRIRTGAHVGSFPALRGLPRNSGGSASATSLSRPARASHELRPARLLTHQKWAWLRGFDPTGCSLGTSGKIARQLPCQPMTTWVAPSSTGDLRRWGALNNPG
jgi:hypothetical protein